MNRDRVVCCNWRAGQSFVGGSLMMRVNGDKEQEVRRCQGELGGEIDKNKKK